MISFDQDSAQPESLVPPRPNLGPEPWPDRQGWPSSADWWMLALVLLVLVAGWRWRRARSKGQTLGSAGPSEISSSGDSSPRQRLIASSEQVRDALIGAFGSPWGSKTTEEIAIEPILLERFERSEVERLITFLTEADRAKFARDESNHLDDWEVWAGGFVARMASGASSRIIGK
jgi:hypothetical protein